MNREPAPEHVWIIRSVPWGLGVALIVFLVLTVWLLVDGRMDLLWGVSSLAALGVILFFIAYDECRLDAETRTVLLRRLRIGRAWKRRFTFDELHAVAVQSSASSDGGAPTYRVVFVLEAGDVLPLTSVGSSGKGRKTKMAERLVAYVNAGRREPVLLALNGIVRLTRGGETDGVDWELDFVHNNDQPPLTLWRTREPSLMQGFLLVLPAGGAKGGALPGGITGSAVRMLYRLMLRNLDLEDAHLPALEQAEIIPGETCGLGKDWTLVSDAGGGGRTWLTPARARRLEDWRRWDPVHGGRGAGMPYLCVQAGSLRMSLRGLFNTREQIAEIARLGCALVRDT